MNLTLHEAARRRFDELASEILGRVQAEAPIDGARGATRPEGTSVDERVTRRLSLADLVPDSLEVTLVTPEGHRVSLAFRLGDASYLIEGAAIDTFEHLLASLKRQRLLSSAVSPRFLEECLVAWLKDRIAAQSVPAFSAFLLEKAASCVTAQTIVVPLEFLRIESAFDFAGVRFDDHAISRAMLDDVEARHLAATPQLEAEVRSKVARYRRWFQGQTCCVVEVLAEPRWAERSACLRVDRALALLRLWSPSAFVPGVPCVVGRVGRVHVPADVSCRMEGGRPKSIHEAVAQGYGQLDWSLSDSERAEIMRLGLDQLEQLVLGDDPNELEQILLHALELLDESVCCSAPHKRVAMALTAAETLFLQDDGEPIQLLLGLRCAKIARRQLGERLAVDKTIRRAYTLRSQYVHHGSVEVDLQLVSDLHVILLDAFVSVARQASRLGTRANFFAELQELIWR